MRALAHLVQGARCKPIGGEDRLGHLAMPPQFVYVLVTCQGDEIKQQKQQQPTARTSSSSQTPVSGHGRTGY